MLPTRPTTPVPGPPFPAPQPSTLNSQPSLPLVTIAIPTYNRADTYFPLTLKSALGQTYPNLEILIADNCSTDHTGDLVTRIGDPRIRYFRHKSNVGQKDNYEFCVNHAKGEYLLLLHDDDLIDEDFVSSCIRTVGATPNVGLIRTGVRLINAEGRLSREMTNDVVGLPVDTFILGWFTGKTAIYCCNTLFNAARLREIDGFKSKHFIYPDTMAIFHLAAQYSRIDIHEVKASFRIHSEEFGLSRRITDWCEDSLELLQFMCDLVPETSRSQVLKEGTRFFCKANFNRASAARSPSERALAVMKVMRYFNYHHLPSLNVTINIFSGTRLYNILRFIKRRAIQPFQPLAAD